jgi:hypothetical protein
MVNPIEQTSQPEGIGQVRKTAQNAAVAQSTDKSLIDFVHGLLQILQD